MSYDVRVVGNQVIRRCKEPGGYDGLTILPLLKLIFFAHGWYLGRFGKDRPLVDSSFRVWTLGPVAPAAYRSFVGGHAVKSTPISLPPWVFKRQLDDDAVKTIDLVVAGYRKFTPYQMVSITQAHGSPWDRCQEEFNAKIPNSLIADYYADWGKTINARLSNE